MFAAIAASFFRQLSNTSTTNDHDVDVIQSVADFDERDEVVAPEDLIESDFINISVSGMKYETLKSTLRRFPDTLLADELRRQDFYNANTDAYYFDRNRESFEAILYYYQCGYLIRPSTIPMRLFVNDVKFFDLGEDVLQELREQEGWTETERDEPKHALQRKIWNLFEHPESSVMARVLATFSVLVITISITVFCMETMPMFERYVPVQEPNNTFANTSIGLPQIMTGNVSANSTIVVDIYQRTNATNATRYPFNHTNNNTRHNRTSNIKYVKSTQQLRMFFCLELSCIVWFTIEYVTRLVTCPSKWKFLCSPLNMIDLLAILPYFITAIVDDSGNNTPLSVLRLVRLVRVFRIFKLSRHSMGLQILGQTLKASLSELMTLVFFMFVGIILFSSGMYYAERTDETSKEEPIFLSIPDAFWYSLVTMTSVGYGDRVPATTLGKVIGSLCVLCGVLTIALPAPVIVSNFEFFYKRDRMHAQGEGVDDLLAANAANREDETNSSSKEENTL